MNCPRCGVTLQMTERQNIEIDYCPQCRGVWLDRGELDKIIERSSQGSSMRNESGQYEHYEDRRYDHDHDHDRHHDDYHYGKKRKGFLSELFD